MFKTILLPTDGSNLSMAAARDAVTLAAAQQSTLVVMSVIELLPFPLYTEAGGAVDLALYEDFARQEAERAVNSIAGLASESGIACKTLTPRALDVALEIVETAQRELCDVIWIASHGRKGLSKLLLGSQTAKVLAATTIPVLVHRTPAV